jgi:hypothetical protein
VAAFVLFLFLWFYPLRKRLRVLSFLGSVSRILDLHIAAGLVIPLLAATHAGWRFTGLIGLGYAAMFVVCLSGVVGRYLLFDTQTRAGPQMSLAEVDAETRLLVELSGMTGLTISSSSACFAWRDPGRTSRGAKTLRRIVADDLARRRFVAELRRELRRTGGERGKVDRDSLHRIAALANRHVAPCSSRLVDSTAGVSLLACCHLPIAVTALLAVIVHGRRDHRRRDMDPIARHHDGHDYDRIFLLTATRIAVI